MNDSSDGGKLLNQQIRVVQIIVGALLAGVLVFAGFVLFSQPANQPPVPAAPIAGAPAPAAPTPILSYAAIAVFAAAVLIWSVVPNRIADREVAKIAAGTWTPSSQSSQATTPLTDSMKLMGVFMSKSIISGALLEGPAFLACVAYMIERHAYTLGIVAALVLLMLVSFPTRGRVFQWLEKQLAFIDETRQFGRPS